LKSLTAYVSGAFNGNTMPGWITWNGGQEHSGHWTINFITKKSIGSCVCIYIYTYNVYILLKYVWYVYIYIKQTRFIIKSNGQVQRRQTCLIDYKYQ
jgi:hypothetical protein